MKIVFLSHGNFFTDPTEILAAEMVLGVHAKFAFVAHFHSFFLAPGLGSSDRYIFFCPGRIHMIKDRSGLFFFHREFHNLTFFSSSTMALLTQIELRLPILSAGRGHFLSRSSKDGNR